MSVLQNGYTVLRHDRKPNLLKRLSQKGDIAYYRQGSFSEEIIWQGRKFLFPSPKKSIQDGMWVFRSVIRDVKDYISKNDIHPKDRLPVNHWNRRLQNFQGKITATDVDHAYWRIAFLQGIISSKTYFKGLEIKDKSLRLAALANLASTKEYYIISEGQVTSKTIILKYDSLLHTLYNNIRFSCFEFMTEMAHMLNDNYICYKTDCIYYIDRPENREKVQQYLESKNMMWKQLYEPDMPIKEKPIGTNPQANS
jgi:hypothetical protein